MILVKNKIIIQFWIDRTIQSLFHFNIYSYTHTYSFFVIIKFHLNSVSWTRKVRAKKKVKAIHREKEKKMINDNFGDEKRKERTEWMKFCCDKILMMLRWWWSFGTMFVHNDSIIINTTHTINQLTNYDCYMIDGIAGYL